ncbi:MAG: endonuclease/exonuclease/phosphatase family protein [Candidatus Thiodiazotropha endolucinida]|nr:endonuclease/exonuclease/phosphatase family protein [Candidatus Thiodiazotropha endolucinida]
MEQSSNLESCASNISTCNKFDPLRNLINSDHEINACVVTDCHISSTDQDMLGLLGNDDLGDSLLNDCSVAFQSNQSESIVDNILTISDHSLRRNDDLQDSLSNDWSNPPKSNQSELITDNISSATDPFAYLSKGLHFCNLNIQHILPKIDEIRLLLSAKNTPDILGICESFLGPHHPDSLISISGYNCIRKDRHDTHDKCGGGLLLYSRQSINVKRRPDIEISNIETIWAEVIQPSSKSFLICTVYRPPNALSSWIDLFETEISVAQSTGLEFLIMGDLNIDMKLCSNSKWLHLVELFDLSQLINNPTRVTDTSSTIIDHVYTSDRGNITECFVASYAVSDHFPVCFSRKVKCKISKDEHIATSYRCFKTFDEQLFLFDLSYLTLCRFTRS